MALKHPEFFFWLFATMLFNPGDFLGKYLGKASLGGFSYMDVFFVLCFVPLLSHKINTSVIFKDQFIKKIIKVQLVFLVYHLIIHGLLVPNHDFAFYIRNFIMRERHTIFYFLLIIPTYIIAVHNMRYFYYMIFYSTAIVLFMFFVSLFTGLNLIEVHTMSRWSGEDVNRIYFAGWGFLQFVIPIGLAVYLLRIHIHFKRILYLTAILALIAVLLTLTKTNYIGTAAYIFITIYLISKLFNVGAVRISNKIIWTVMAFLISSSFLFPEYLGYGERAARDIYGVFTTGERSDGTMEGRLVNQVPAQLLVIKKYPIFGLGAKSKIYNEGYGGYRSSDLDVTDLPILGHIMQYGFVGISLYSLFYFNIIIVIRRLYFNLKNQNKNILLSNYKLEILLAILILTYFVNHFVFRIPYLFKELTTGRISIALMAGAMCALNYTFTNQPIRKTNNA